MPYHIKLSRALKEKNRNMTLDAIALEAGVSKNTVIKYMRSDFESDNLYTSANKLAQACGYDPNILTEWAEFYEDDESPENQNTASPLVA